ncbi:MAG: hypothetical protein J0I79_22325 [Mesorhizobium sp.]|uniref:hypothetical protein n=1 Tax=Mesorhizobium sp. TaxID=1871066 RepID=UPI001AD2BFD0|nr:hypothetical protein [Mesorhizobium sp.]MBN9220693.1 hypothetical protein [Mesorhizobium sp.]
MDDLFFTLWQRPGRRAGRRQDFWLDTPASGLHRLLAALAIIGALACLLEHAAADKADTPVTASYGSSQQGSPK